MASQSPYRKELLERLAIDFTCIPSHVDEDQVKQKISDPLKLTQELSFLKAHKIFQENPDSIVIGSDQVSVLHGDILGKPYTKENAHKQLSQMSGQAHALITGVCVLAPGSKFEFYDHTNLHMRDLTPEQITSYIEKDDPLHCAGSYKIESLGISLFSSIDTKDFTAITGLPLIELTTVLHKLGAI